MFSDPPCSFTIFCLLFGVYNLGFSVSNLSLAVFHAVVLSQPRSGIFLQGRSPVYVQQNGFYFAFNYSEALFAARFLTGT
jgi:hypothetical protein